MHYNEILRFRRGKMYGLLTMYSIFVDGFEMQALNHVCILHLIWSWVSPQGPHAKKYLYHAGLDPRVRIFTHMQRSTYTIPLSVCRYIFA